MQPQNTGRGASGVAAVEQTEPPGRSAGPLPPSSRHPPPARLLNPRPGIALLHCSATGRCYTAVLQGAAGFGYSYGRCSTVEPPLLLDRRAEPSGPWEVLMALTDNYSRRPTENYAGLMDRSALWSGRQADWAGRGPAGSRRQLSFRHWRNFICHDVQM
jgi:hypothetical protein